jgi:uncharacterized protein (TIGR03067 family)
METRDPSMSIGLIATTALLLSASRTEVQFTKALQMPPYGTRVACANVLKAVALWYDLTGQPWVNLFSLIGAPPSELCVLVLGGHMYYRYPSIGVEIETNEGGEQGPKIVDIRPIPPKYPPDMPRTVKKAMKKLEGAWEQVEEGRNGKRKPVPKMCRTTFLFNGQYLTLVGGGIAPSFYYQVELAKTPNRIIAFLPDSEASKELNLPWRGIFMLQGKNLKIQLGPKKFPKKFGGKTNDVIYLRRKRLEVSLDQASK